MNTGDRQTRFTKSKVRFGQGIVAISLFLLTSSSMAQIHRWSKSFGGYPTAIEHDQKGNIYVTGNIQELTDLDPGPGEYLVDASDGREGYISKFDPEGHLIWARTWDANESLPATDMSLDPDGNVIVVGDFQGKVDFDPGPDTFFLHSQLDADVVILKLDNNGYFLWAKNLGDQNPIAGQGVNVDHEGNIIATGYFRDTIDFDPGPDSISMISFGKPDVFILKLDQNGNFIWCKHVGGVESDMGRNVDVDENGNIYTAGFFGVSGDFDPGIGVFTLNAHSSSQDVFVLKLDPNGEFIWAGSMGSSGQDDVNGFEADDDGNVYTTGFFRNIGDFDPGPENFPLSSVGYIDAYLSKLDSEGQFVYAKSIGGSDDDRGECIDIDSEGNVYWGGFFHFEVDFDPGISTHLLEGKGERDAFVLRLDNTGNFVWAEVFANPFDENDVMTGVMLNSTRQLILAGQFNSVIDFDPANGKAEQIALEKGSVFLAAYAEQGVTGSIFNDITTDCSQASNEIGLSKRRAIIQPGDWVVETNNGGIWFIDSLPAGNYAMTVDTFGDWHPSCENSIDFGVADPEQLTLAPDFGLIHSDACPIPYVTIQSAILRRCFDDQSVKVHACNLPNATGALFDAYVIVEMDTLLIVSHASLPYTSLGGNQFRFDIGTLLPGECLDIAIKVRLRCEAMLGQTVCMEARMFPKDDCLFGTSETLTTPSLPPCAYEEDNSHLIVEGWCEGSSLYFTVLNTGEIGSGNMKCFAPTRLYIDGALILLDSVHLEAGEADTFIYSGDGRTFRFEVDQHPSHFPGSLPNKTIERCGGDVNWTPGFFNSMAHDDAEASTDISCNIIRGSYDPNDKNCIPVGIDADHKILPNRQMDYVIRFQNTGNDTAFFVVIRDTLDANLEILSVEQGASSHHCEFKMYDQRVLEWTFENILLPDSTTDLAGSNGFVSFHVNQAKDLPDGTIITNSAAIYFDYNDPVITNTTLQTVDRQLGVRSWDVKKETNLVACSDTIINGWLYNQPGRYFQILSGGNKSDTLLQFDLELRIDDRWTEVSQSGNTLSTEVNNALYQWYDCENGLIISGATSQTFIPVTSGEYAVIISQQGCVDTTSCSLFELVGTSYPVESALSFSPNPTSGQVDINFKKVLSNLEIQLFDVFGRKLKHQVYKDVREIHFNIEETVGLYYIVLNTEIDIITLKVVKE